MAYYIRGIPLFLVVFLSTGKGKTSLSITHLRSGVIEETTKNPGTGTGTGTGTDIMSNWTKIV